MSNLSIYLNNENKEMLQKASIFYGISAEKMILVKAIEKIKEEGHITDDSLNKIIDVNKDSINSISIRLSDDDREFIKKHLIYKGMGVNQSIYSLFYSIFKLLDDNTINQIFTFSNHFLSENYNPDDVKYSDELSNLKADYNQKLAKIKLMWSQGRKFTDGDTHNKDFLYLIKETLKAFSGVFYKEYPNMRPIGKKSIQREI